MRLSKASDHPWYIPGPWLAETYLNGAKLERVLAVDDRQGVAICAKVDKAGNIMVRDGEILTEIRRGNVCIVVPDEYRELLTKG